MIVLRIPPCAETTIADLNPNMDFSDMCRTIHLHRTKRLDRTIHWCGQNLSWAEPSGPTSLAVNSPLVTVVLFFSIAVGLCQHHLPSTFQPPPIF